MTPTREHENEPAWLVLARKELARGVKEVSGPVANPRILEYFASTKLAPLAGDETPWCSAFACWCMEHAGVPSPKRANARAWLTWGEELVRPRMGCVCVLSRGLNPKDGHVGFWIGETAGSVLLLAGNQGNRVSIGAFPMMRLIGYRWPTGPRAA